MLGVAALTFQVYDNIGFEALGALLGLDAEAAEATACKMIGQGRSVVSR